MLEVTDLFVEVKYGTIRNKRVSEYDDGKNYSH